MKHFYNFCDMDTTTIMYCNKARAQSGAARYATPFFRAIFW
jgi:hypothetical protein